MSKQKEPDHTTLNLVGTATVINGEIISKGDIRIDGTVTGTIKSEGKIVVGNSGKIEGDIFCKNADFSGKIKGKADVTELLTLKASSQFIGDIITDKLAIEPGARFSGTCSMEKNADASKVDNLNKKK